MAELFLLLLQLHKVSSKFQITFLCCIEMMRKSSLSRSSTQENLSKWMDHLFDASQKPATFSPEWRNKV